MNINEWSKEIHENAVNHGWWEEEREYGEIIALIHSELSEALEEYRDGKPYVYCDEYDKDCGNCLKYRDTCPCNANKPEGIAVELADCVIRILDWFGREGIDISSDTMIKETVKSYKAFQHAETKSFPAFVAEMHYLVSQSWSRGKAVLLIHIIANTDAWLGAQGINLWKIVRIKHEYNKTRPYRHGGKVC